MTDKRLENYHSQTTRGGVCAQDTVFNPDPGLEQKEI